VEGGNGVPTTHDATTNTAAENEHGESSSVTRQNKRAKTIDLDSDPLVAAFTSSSERLATAMEKLATGNMDLPPDCDPLVAALLCTLRLSNYLSLIAHGNVYYPNIVTVVIYFMCIQQG
jgi:hypothetical protein